MRLRTVDRVVHPPAALLHADRAPLVLYKRTEEKSPQNPDIRQPKQQEENAIYRNEGETAGVYLGEEAVLGEELGDLGREDDVSARKKGIRLGFCQPPQRKEMGKGENHDSEGFASTCTRRYRRSTSRSTGSDPCPPTLLDQLPYRKIPKISAESPQKQPNRAAKRSEPRFRGTFRGEYEKSKDWGVGRRRAYLGAGAVLQRSADTSRSEGSVLEETVGVAG